MNCNTTRRHSFIYLKKKLFLINLHHYKSTSSNHWRNNDQILNFKRIQCSLLDDTNVENKTLLINHIVMFFSPHMILHLFVGYFYQYSQHNELSIMDKLQFITCIFPSEYHQFCLFC